MIRFKLPSLRKTVYQVPTLVPPIKSPPLNPLSQTLLHEAARRDKIVQDLYKKCTYKEGDFAEPVEEGWIAKYGKDILVEAICTRYSHMGPSEKWPEDDNPLIVQAWSNEKSERFYCTTNFLKKV